MELSIGRLAALSGVSVKTIRYYSDIGLVPECHRTESGYRRYDDTALARLELVRTLRDLGLDIATTRRVAASQSTMEEVAAAHAAATDAQIRRLTLRRAVLRAVARGISRPEEVQRMTEFARASAEENRRTLEEFLDAVFAGHEANPFADRMRSALPVLADDASDAQIDAWIELAAMVRDPSFRERVREMVIKGERQRAATGVSDTDEATQAAGAAVVEKAGSAVAAGVRPDSAAAAPVVDELVGRFAAAAGRSDDAGYRAELLAQLRTFSDARVERYWHLAAAVNGWPAQPSMMPAYEWFIAGLATQASDAPQAGQSSRSHNGR